MGASAGWLPEQGFASPTRLSDVGEGKREVNHVHSVETKRICGLW